MGALKRWRGSDEQRRLEVCVLVLSGDVRAVLCQLLGYRPMSTMYPERDDDIRPFTGNRPQPGVAVGDWLRLVGDAQPRSVTSPQDEYLFNVCLPKDRIEEVRKPSGETWRR